MNDWVCHVRSKLFEAPAAKSITLSQHARKNDLVVRMNPGMSNRLALPILAQTCRAGKSKEEERERM